MTYNADPKEGNLTTESKIVRGDLVTFFRGANIGVIGTIIGSGLIFGRDIFLARTLGAQQFGLYSIGWMILNLFMGLAIFGLDYSVIHFVSKFDGLDQKHLKGNVAQALFTPILVGGLFGLILYILAPTIANRIFHDPELMRVFQQFSPGFALFGGLTVSAACHQAFKNIKYSILVLQILQPLTQIILIVIFLFLFSQGLSGAISAAIISLGIAFFIALLLLRKTYPGFFNPTQQAIYSHQIYKYSFPIFVESFLNILYLRANQFIIGLLLTSTQVGIYQAALQLSLGLNLIRKGFIVVLAPQFADLFIKGNKERLARIYQTSIKAGLVISFPITVVLMIHSKEILSLFYGNEYAPGSSAFIFLACSIIIPIALGPVSILLTVTGHQVQRLKLSLISLLSSIFLSLFLIPFYGILGAALGTLLSTILGGMITLIYLRRIYGFGR